MSLGCIYKVSSPSGKCYIGQTIDFEKRKFCHINETNRQNGREYDYPLHRAIRKYGDQLKWEILYDGIPEDQLDVAEIMAIYLYDSYYGGYNQTFGGDGNRGYRITEDVRKKMSENNKGEKNPRWGSHWSEEERRQMSERQKGDKSPMYGKPLAKEIRDKISESTKGSKNHNFGKTMSQETKMKLSRSKQNISKDTLLKLSISHGARPFNVYEKDTNIFVGQWTIISECAKDLGIQRQNMSKCLNHPEKYHSCGGYIFKYVEQPTP